MKIVEISEAEFNAIKEVGKTYYTNGCMFDDKTDNLLAFPFYKDESSEPEKFFKVV